MATSPQQQQPLKYNNLWQWSVNQQLTKGPDKAPLFIVTGVKVSPYCELLVFVFVSIKMLPLPPPKKEV